MWSPRRDSNRRPFDYESWSTRPARADRSHPRSSRRRARLSSAVLTRGVTAGGMTKGMTNLPEAETPGPPRPFVRSRMVEVQPEARQAYPKAPATRLYPDAAPEVWPGANPPQRRAAAPGCWPARLACARLGLSTTAHRPARLSTASASWACGGRQEGEGNPSPSYAPPVASPGLEGGAPQAALGNGHRARIGLST
jgi:hypothetical protein